MAECRHCTHQLEHLIELTNEEYGSTVRLTRSDDEKNSPDYDDINEIMVIEDPDEELVETKFICPECRKEVADTRRKAAEILRGERL